jgi:hypothetical protein
MPKVIFFLNLGEFQIETVNINVRYDSGGSMKLNARILLLAHMVYL